MKTGKLMVLRTKGNTQFVLVAPDNTVTTYLPDMNLWMLGNVGKQIQIIEDGGTVAFIVNDNGQ